MKWHWYRQGDFYKKMKQLTNSKVTPTDTILGEGERELACGKRHFQSVLNVHSTVAEEALSGLVCETKILTVEEQGKNQQVRDQSTITLRGQALEELK